MARKSIFERAAELEKRGVGGTEPVATAALSPVHVQTVSVMGELLTMGEHLSGDDTPMHLRMMLQMFRKVEPMLTEQLASIPPAKIAGFMGELAAKMNSIAVLADPAGAANSDATAPAAIAQ